MATIKEIKVPDIGDFNDVPVIEVLIQAGDTIKVEDPLITIESDKATMEVPSSEAGVVKEVKIKVGDKVSQGGLILLLESTDAGEPAVASVPTVSPPPAAVSAPAGVAEVRVPDIGDFTDVPVIEVLVKPGDSVKAEDPLITLESDKATMEVPAPLGGVVQEILVRVGDSVSEGAVILTLVTGAVSTVTSSAPVAATSPTTNASPATPLPSPVAPTAAAGVIDETAFRLAYAGPAVRKLARELGVDLGKLTGTGDKGRIIRQDVEAFAKRGDSAPTPSASASASASGAGLDLLPWPKVDFTKFGAIETRPLARIKKISAANLHRNWVMIPHVTTHDDADITDLEAFRVQLNKENEKAGVKLSMLAFMIKAATFALKKFPEFNASLDGDNLILKQYYHIGFAADTPNGLVVPVIRDADRKGVIEIGKEMGELAKLAREGKLKPDQMQGGSFTISSLGGIGGTYFTPIINAPEVAIMGVCKSYWKQVSPDGKQSAWRLTLPLSLSWDHRVIDGAAAARFNVYFANLLADLRRVLV
ncbi:dihydrolipoyllysine-residue acetyltransferase [Paraburkholderia caffeinilytica]|uniref:dihydrolipoyllysine-residue acetyltransferase n=1 Tax=Paraburkholderia caffeinilytica TaxID=1761016 RepID=UPI0038B953D1